MKENDFLLEMESKGWILDSKPVETNNVRLSALASKRLEKAPKEFIQFITSFTSLANSDETTWFLSYTDFVDNDDIAFPWNEFENQSLDVFADDEEMNEGVKSYWDSHIPFIMSVKNGYSYISICIKGSSLGKIFKGEEPEYENSICIYDTLQDCLEAFLKKDLL